MIEIFRWRMLDRWDAFTVPHLHISPHLSQKKIRDLLKPRVERVDRKEWSFGQLQPITVHFGGDISRRSVKEGKSYSMDLFWVRPGDVVLSKIDLKNGAVGVLPDSWENVVVTSHFKVYTPDLEQIDPRYLKYLLRTDDFKAWLWANRSGTDGRTEIPLEVFEGLEIPLPSKAQQSELCDSYEAALNEGASKEQEADAIERAGWQAFESALGIAPPPPLPSQPVFIALFTNLDRWSHEGILDAIARANAPDWSGAIPEKRLGELIADLSNGWSPKCLNRAAKPEEWGVLKVGAVSFGEFNQAENKALPSHLKAKSGLEVQNGDVLIGRANVMRLVGACAIVRETRPRLMLCDKIFRVIFRPDSKIDAEFLSEVMKLSTVRQQIEAKATGTSPTMKNISKPSLLGLKFPVPDGPDGLETQRALVGSLKTARDTATALRIEAANLRTSAWEAFESALFEAPELAAV